MAGALGQPGLLVGHRQRIEVLRRPRCIVDPFAQQRTAVDDVDGELSVFVLVGEIAPERVVGVETADRLEGERLNTPRFEYPVIVAAILRVDLNAVAELAYVLVKR